MIFSAGWSSVNLSRRPFGFFAYFHGICGEGDTEYDPPFREFWTLYIGKLWLGTTRCFPGTPGAPHE